MSFLSPAFNSERLSGQALKPARTFWAIAASALCIAIIYRCIAVQNHDVAWLVSCAEWLLDGKRMSVDFFEVNPPGAVLIYLPAAALGRLIHVPSGFINEVIIFFAAALNIHFASTRFASLSDVPWARAAIAAGLTVILLILPANEFAQREHIGVLLLLPWLAITATPSLPASQFLRGLAGACVGLAVVAKPHFAIFPALVQLALIARDRNLMRLFSLENICAGLVLVIYAALIYFMYQDFLNVVLPRAAEVYLPSRVPLRLLVIMPPAGVFYILTFLSLFLRIRDSRLADVADILTLAAAAGLASFLIQGKGSDYHALPAQFFGMAAVVVRLVDARAHLQRRLPALIFALVAAWCIGQTWILHNDKNEPRIRALAAAVSRLDPAPRIMTVSADISLGFPLVRMTNGTWVQREPFMWLSWCAQWLVRANPGVQKMLDLQTRYDALERKILNEDITHGRPTIILIQGNAYKVDCQSIDGHF